MADRIPMTPRGVKKLREELKRLREVERPKNVQDIEIARAHGDISENAEFSAAKERQAFIEGRSREIDSILAQSEVIDPATLSGDRVVFGATVRLADTDSGEEINYSIVGDHEGDIKEGRLTISARWRAPSSAAKRATQSPCAPARAAANTRSWMFSFFPCKTPERHARNRSRLPGLGQRPGLSRR